MDKLPENENLMFYLARVKDIIDYYRLKYEDLQFNLNQVKIDDTVTVILEVKCPEYIIAFANPIFDKKNGYFGLLNEIFTSLNRIAMESMGESVRLEDIVRMDESKLNPQQLKTLEEVRRLSKNMPIIEISRVRKAFEGGGFSFETMTLRFECSFVE
ncbi:MAG: hypothetical protein ABI721_00530 [Candidatus Dojkabacteria bacterium]